MSAAYMGAPPYTMVLIPVQSAPVASAWSTSRLTMVGAANIDSRPMAPAASNTSAASKPPEAGTTWRAPAITCGMA